MRSSFEFPLAVNASVQLCICLCVPCDTHMLHGICVYAMRQTGEQSRVDPALAHTRLRSASTPCDSDAGYGQAFIGSIGEICHGLQTVFKMKIKTISEQLIYFFTT